MDKIKELYMALEFTTRRFTGDEGFIRDCQSQPAYNGTGFARKFSGIVTGSTEELSKIPGWEALFRAAKNNRVQPGILLDAATNSSLAIILRTEDQNFPWRYSARILALSEISQREKTQIGAINEAFENLEEARINLSEWFLNSQTPRRIRKAKLRGIRATEKLLRKVKRSLTQ